MYSKLRHCEKATKFEKFHTCFDVYLIVSSVIFLSHVLCGACSIIAAALNLDPENSSCLKQVKILQKCAINTLVSTT